MEGPDPSLRAELTDIVGPDQVLVDDDVTAGYRVDWTGRFRAPPAWVVRPATTEQVAAVIAACRRRGAALVPQGGNTGLVGGSVPLGGEIVLSLRRMDHVGEVDPAGGHLTAGAGATIGAVHAAAGAAGWAYGVDLASRDSATVGGTIATNAGGLRVLRYGGTRAQVLGVEAVLGDGTVVSTLGGLLRDNTGVHVPSLLCGSEGTLGVVTAAVLRLVPEPRARVAALVAFASVEAAARAAGEVRRQLAALESVELVLADGVALVCEVGGLAPPFPARHPAYLLVEAAADDDPGDTLADVVASLAGVADAAVATDPARRRALWAYRERHTEAINTLGAPHKLDVAVPVGRLPELVARAPETVGSAAPAARVWLFGHAADGNVHVNVTGVDPDDEAVDDAVLRLVVDLGGSISAEHGIGTAKRRWLSLTRTEAELAAARRLKAVFDPDGILNPAVLVPVAAG